MSFRFAPALDLLQKLAQEIVVEVKLRTTSGNALLEGGYSPLRTAQLVGRPRETGMGLPLFRIEPPEAIEQLVGFLEFVCLDQFLGLRERRRIVQPAVAAGGSPARWLWLMMKW